MNKQELRELKFNRLKPEERFFIQIFDGLIVEESQVNGDYFFYFKNDYCYFYHDTKNNIFWYDYNTIWSDFKSKFNYSNNQTNEFIKCMVEKNFKINGIIISIHQTQTLKMVENYLKK